MLGKRKRDSTVQRRNADSIVTETLPSNQQLFQHYFESRFEPLQEEQMGTPSLIEEQSPTEDNAFSDSEWAGFSEPEELATGVEVVNHAHQLLTEDGDRRPSGSRAFMSSKPPREIGLSKEKDIEVRDLETDSSETLNLKHDLDLQRLLKESHLLDQAKGCPDLGTHRHKANDLHLQSLNSKVSLFRQEKMPMLHRRGMAAKAQAREISRRKQAQANGIVLEKATFSANTASTKSRRERAVDVPSFGKFRGGTLKLSRKDVASIQSPKFSSNRPRRRVR